MRLIDADKFEATIRSHIISNNHSAIRLNTNQIANNDAILDCIDWLHKEPTVEERPTGEWIGNNFDEHHCNKCGHYALWEEEPDGYYEAQSRFCPNCGAYMKKEAENDK